MIIMNKNNNNKLIECDVCFNFFNEIDIIFDKGFDLCRNCYNATYNPALHKALNKNTLKKEVL